MLQLELQVLREVRHVGLMVLKVALRLLLGDVEPRTLLFELRSIFSIFNTPLNLLVS